MQDVKSQKNEFFSIFNVLADIRLYALAVFLSYVSLFLKAGSLQLASLSMEVSSMPVFVGMVGIALVLFYGICALGILILENHCNGNNISIKAAIVKALKIGHRFILANILLFLALVLFFTPLYTWVTFFRDLFIVFGGLFWSALLAIVILAVMVFWVTIQPLLLGFTWQGFTLKQSFTAILNVYKKNGSKLFIYSMLIFVVVLPTIAFLLSFFVPLTDFISYFLIFFSYIFWFFDAEYMSDLGYLLGLYLAFLYSILLILVVRLILYVYQLATQDVDLTSTLSSSRQIPNSGSNKTKQAVNKVSKESNKQEKVNQEQLKISNNVKQTGENKLQEQY